jgi:hypothetical protein
MAAFTQRNIPLDLGFIREVEAKLGEQYELVPLD